MRCVKAIEAVECKVIGMISLTRQRYGETMHRINNCFHVSSAFLCIFEKHIDQVAAR